MIEGMAGMLGVIIVTILIILLVAIISNAKKILRFTKKLITVIWNMEAKEKR